MYEARARHASEFYEWMNGRARALSRACEWTNERDLGEASIVSVRARRPGPNGDRALAYDYIFIYMYVYILCSCMYNVYVYACICRGARARLLGFSRFACRGRVENRAVLLTSSYIRGLQSNIPSLGRTARWRLYVTRTRRGSIIPLSLSVSLRTRGNAPSILTDKCIHEILKVTFVPWSFEEECVSFLFSFLTIIRNTKIFCWRKKTLLRNRMIYYLAISGKQSMPIFEEWLFFCYFWYNKIWNKNLWI